MSIQSVTHDKYPVWMNSICIIIDFLYDIPPRKCTEHIINQEFPLLIQHYIIKIISSLMSIFLSIYRLTHDCHNLIIISHLKIVAYKHLRCENHLIFQFTIFPSKLNILWQSTLNVWCLVNWKFIISCPKIAYIELNVLLVDNNSNNNRKRQMCIQFNELWYTKIVQAPININTIKNQVTWNWYTFINNLIIIFRWYQQKLDGVWKIN
jgi:hypothetical protein